MYLADANTSWQAPFGLGMIGILIGLGILIFREHQRNPNHSPTKRQVRWAFAAERRGQLKRGTAKRWAKRR